MIFPGLVVFVYWNCDIISDTCSARTLQYFAKGLWTEWCIIDSLFSFCFLLELDCVTLMRRGFQTATHLNELLFLSVSTVPYVFCVLSLKWLFLLFENKLNTGGISCLLVFFYNAMASPMLRLVVYIVTVLKKFRFRFFFVFVTILAFWKRFLVFRY